MDEDIKSGARRDGRVAAVDYAYRNRTLEFRGNWFHLTRPLDDAELIRERSAAYEHKLRAIERMRERGAYGPIIDNNPPGPPPPPGPPTSPPGAGSPWYSIGPRNINGRVRAIAVHPTDPNTLYAGAAAGGVWKSSDAGLSWYPLTDYLPSLSIGAIGIAPSSPNTVYVGSGEAVSSTFLGTFPGAGVYVSTDGGSTWTVQSALANRRVTAVFVKSTDANTVYAAGLSGLERSTDGGVTWTMLKAGIVSDAAIDPTNDSVIYICLQHDGVYKSTDAGATFAKLTGAPAAAGTTWTKITVGKNGAHASNFVVIKMGMTAASSTNGGTTWTTLGALAIAYPGYCDLICVAPDDESIVLAGGAGLQRSVNGGTTFADVAVVHPDHHQAVFAPSNTNIVYECNDGGVYRSADKGATFTKVSNGLVITQFYDLGTWSRISNVLGGGVQDQGTNVTTGGLTWEQIFGGDGGYLAIDPTDPHIMYCESEGMAIVKTVDGAHTWNPGTSGLTGTSPWMGVLTLDENNPATLFTGTTKVFRTTNALATPWNAVSQDFGTVISAIAIAPSDSTRLYAATGDAIRLAGHGDVFRNDDGGATSSWAIKTGTLPNTRPVLRIAVDAADKDRVALCYGGTSGSSTGHVFLSTNGGTTWTDISGTLPDISTNAVVFDPSDANTLYAGTDVGLYRTTDLGMTWDPFDNGIPNVVIMDMRIDTMTKMLYAATFGRGVYKLDVTPGVVKSSVDLYVRHDLLDTGERVPTPSDLPNPLDPSARVYWWESPDIKLNHAPYYVAPAVLDGVNFDVDLVHDDPLSGLVNRVYLQVHNRGWRTTSNVSVRAFFADATAGLPPFPNALVPPAFNLTSTANWKPVGPAQTIATLEPNRPVVVTWDLALPLGAATHTCLFAVVSCADDPMTNTQTNANILASTEKHVCLKNLHVIAGGIPPQEPLFVTIDFYNAEEREELIDIIIDPQNFGRGTIGLQLGKRILDDVKTALAGVTRYALRDNEIVGRWRHPSGDQDAPRRELTAELDRSLIYDFDPRKRSELCGIRLAAGERLRAVIACKAGSRSSSGATQQFTVMQRQGGNVVGGSTYEWRTVSGGAASKGGRVRVMLERFAAHERHRDRELFALVRFNDDPYRRHLHPLARHSKRPICLFDGYFAAGDAMTVAIVELDDERADSPTRMFYQRRFAAPATSWAGSYTHATDRDRDDVVAGFMYSVALVPLPGGVDETD